MRGATSTLLGLMLGMAGWVHAAVEAPLPTHHQQHLANRGLSDYDAHYSTGRIANDIVGHQLSAASAVSRTYPECWTASLASIAQWTDGGLAPTSGSSYCASMSSEEKHVLALELTNCQLMKEGRSFFKSNPAASDESPGAETDAVAEASQGEHPVCKIGRGKPYSSSSCLPLGSDYAMRLYHNIFIHTQDACARLTEERMLLQKEEVTQMLVYASSAVSSQMQDTVAAVREQTSQLLEEQASRMEEQLLQSERMHAEREAAAASAMKRMASQTATLLQDQSSMMKEQRLESDRLHKQREEAATSALEQMANRTASLLQNQAAVLLAEQAEKIDKQKRDLERMQEMISNANSQMQPLSSIESYVRWATGSFTVLKALLNFFVSMNVAWMITAMPMLSRGRRYLFLAFAFGFLAEVAVVWFADTPLVVDMGGPDAIETLRDYARVIAVATLVLSFLASCVSHPKKNASSITVDELLKSQLELVAKLNASAPMQTTAERIEGSVSAGKPRSSAVGFSEKRGRSRERFVDEVQSAARSFKPRRRRSRSPYRSSSTELAMPVVTPVKPRHPPSIAAASTAPMPRADYQSTYYIHRSDALARQEEETLRREIQRTGAMQKLAKSGATDGVEYSSTASYSSEESLTGGPYANRSKKRTLSEMYTSSGEDAEFYSANDEEMSVSSDRSDTSQGERKRVKVFN